MIPKANRKLSFVVAIATAVTSLINMGAGQQIFAISAELATPAEFESISDKSERAIAIFNEMGKVLQHPRCINCHPRTDRPNQGDNMRPHIPPVARGPDGLGKPAMRCTTCHGEKNFSFGGDRGSLPGHDVWHLAPASMAWEDRSLGEICEQLKDPARNGGRTLAELQEHNAEDGLVGWGWSPGEGREAVPGSQELFGALTAAWIENGAHCPDS